MRNEILEPTEHDLAYERAVRRENKELNPVIVIPGILGSQLVDEDYAKSVWGDFGKKFAHPNSEANLRKVALPMARKEKLHRLISTTKSDGSMRYVKGSIAGLPVRINAYAGLLEAMGIGANAMGGRLTKLEDYVGNCQNNCRLNR